MATEFVLNVSLLEKFLSSHESQRLDSAMSTICHITIQHRGAKTALLFSSHDVCCFSMTVVLENSFRTTPVA
jgi:hypothetical protein